MPECHKSEPEKREQMKAGYGNWERFKEARKKTGLTQKALADALGFNASYFSLIETRRQPVSNPIAEKMQTLYGIDPWWLLNGNTQKGEKNRLRQARDELGMKQKDLAAILGISSMYLGMMERDEQSVSFPVATKMQLLYSFNSNLILYGLSP